MFVFRPLSVLAARLPSILWGIDTGSLYDTWKQNQSVLPSLLPFRTPQAKAKLLG